MTTYHVRVFAGAETLFYHAQHCRTNQKSLSYEEVQLLLKTSKPVAQETEQTRKKSSPSSDSEGQVPPHELTHPHSPRMVGPSAGDLLGDESAPRFEADMEVRDIEEVSGGESKRPEGIAGEEIPAATETVSREEWMRPGEVTFTNSLIDVC